MTETPDQPLSISSTSSKFVIASMKDSRRFRQVYVTALCWSICSVIVCGCAGVGESLHLQSTVLVKLPIDHPIAAANADDWEFRHILEAPNDAKRLTQWYVARND